jgi:hypothetical protein
MDHWDSTPRLAFLSAEPESGKTRALEITELLVPNPVQAINVSPSYLFRKVGSEEGATILFDEIDTVFGPKAKENEELRGLLNAGHRRGAVTGRCAVKGKETVPEEIPAYAAVALAGIGWLPDTILSRSVIIRMQRRHAGEKVEPYRRRIHASEGNAIRDTIAAWARGFELNEWPELPPGIEDRSADVWEPLIAIADAIGGDWPKRARNAAVTLVTAAKEVEPSLGVRLLANIREVFDAEKFPTKVLLEKLYALPESDSVTAVANGHSENASIHNNVADVADVADLAAMGRALCDHCGQPGKLQTCSVDGQEIHLHRQCQDAWLRMEIPPRLDRRAELSA